jgi:DNA invertase Pin-like site-specific DNA recombinase
MTPAKQLRAGIYGRQSKNKAKSIEDQLVECRADAADCGYLIVAEYSEGSSASRYARRAREEWARVLAAVERREFDVLVLWEASRGDRRLTTWSALLDDCRARGVLIRVTNDARTYDLSIDTDWRTLATAGVDAAHEAGKTSKRVRRGVDSAAKQGRPHGGPAPYGYRRTYDPTTGELVGLTPNETTAPIAREIIERAARSEPISTITNDLNARGVAPPAGVAWYRQRVTKIATNPVYIGQRRHNGERYAAQWPALVDEATHYAAVRILTDPARSVHARPGRITYLLTYIATCGTCGGPIRNRVLDYQCPHGHVSVRRPPVDEYVVELVLAYLTRPDVYATLRAQGEGADIEAMSARGEVAALRARLDEWRASAATGQTSPESLAAIEGTLARQIRSAEQRADRASLPPAMRVVLEPGADVRARWDAAPLAARRTVIATLVDVTLHPSGHNAYRSIEDRVTVGLRMLSA